MPRTTLGARAAASRRMMALYISAGHRKEHPEVGGLRRCRLGGAPALAPPRRAGSVAMPFPLRTAINAASSCMLVAMGGCVEGSGTSAGSRWGLLPRGTWVLRELRERAAGGGDEGNA